MSLTHSRYSLKRATFGSAFETVGHRLEAVTSCGGSSGSIYSGVTSYPIVPYFNMAMISWATFSATSINKIF